MLSAAPINGSTANPSSAPARGGAASVDFENFLKLLTTQLRYQDPLSPLDSTEFVAQLAGFSTVEQLVNANARLEAIAAGMNSAGLDDYAGWIGQVAETTEAPMIFDGTPAPFRIARNEAAERVDLVVRNAAGAIVHRTALANSDDVLLWDGTTASGPAPAGIYRLSAEYFDSSGKLIAEAPASTFSTVLGVRLAGGAVLVRLAGGFEIDPARVTGLGQSF